MDGRGVRILFLEFWIFGCQNRILKLRMVVSVFGYPSYDNGRKSFRILSLK